MKQECGRCGAYYDEDRHHACRPDGTHEHRFDVPVVYVAGANPAPHRDYDVPLEQARVVRVTRLACSVGDCEAVKQVKHG